MKKLLILAVAAAVLSASAEQADHWTFDGATITDGEWTFAATVKAGTTEMTVGAVSKDPGTGATLDFSKPVEGGYVVVELNPNFSAYAGKANLATLILPLEGLVAISDNAFNGCTALMRIDNYIPDSVTTLGSGAFRLVPAQQLLRLENVADINSSSFYGAGISSVHFGPALKSIAGGWASGAFQECWNLTNLTFDAAITNAYFTGTEGHFRKCKKLTGTIDLRGFKSVKFGTNGTGCPFSGCTAVSEIIFGPALESLGVGAISGMSGLKKITFMGPPPTFYKTPSSTGEGDFFGNIGNGIMIATYVQEEHAEKWGAFAKDGVVNSTTSCWAEPWAAAAAQDNRPLIYKKSGGGGELGDWVFDSATSTVTNGAWKFSATAGGARLVVDSCLGAPEQVSKLDFSLSVTDEEGGEMLFVGLNTSFSGTPSYAVKVGELVIPDTVTSIGNNAFNGCTALTNIVNYLPDSVTSLGNNAFCMVPSKQDLRLWSVSAVNGAAFYGSGVTSVYFGPALKSIAGGWVSGAFQGCSSLTNLVFDTAITDAEFAGNQSHFENCKALAGTIDLRGFKSINVGTAGGTACPFPGCVKIEKFILGEGLVSLGMNAFTIGNGSRLNTVEFLGPAPKFYSTTSATTDTPQLFGTMGMVTTLVYKANLKVPVADGFKTWSDYAEGGKIYLRRSTWARECVNDAVLLKNRPLLCPDGVLPGLKLIVR